MGIEICVAKQTKPTTPLAMSKPIAGNHNDLFDIEVYFEDITN